MKGVYLLHFDQPMDHGAQAPTLHYMGYADDIDKRIERHRQGNGAKLMAAIASRGIGFQLARVWPGANRTEERRIKNFGGHRRVCPICRAMERGDRNV